MTIFVIGIFLQLFGGSFFGLGLLDAQKAKEFAMRQPVGAPVLGKGFLMYPHRPSSGLLDTAHTALFSLLILGFLVAIAALISLLPFVSLSAALTAVALLVTALFLTFMGGIPRVRSVADFYAFALMPPLNALGGLLAASVVGLFVTMPTCQKIVVALIITLAALTVQFIALSTTWVLSRFARIALLSVGAVTYGLGVWLMGP